MTSRRLRVTHVTTLFPSATGRVVRDEKYRPGGAERVVQDLCAALSPAVDVTVLTTAAESQGRQEDVSGYRVVRHGSVASLHSANISPGLMLGRQPGEPPDLVHLHLTTAPGVLGAMRLARRAKVPLVVTHHGGDAFIPNGHWLRDAALRYHTNRLVPKVLQQASRIIVPSAGYAEESPVVRANASKVRTIPNGIAPHGEPAGKAPLGGRELRVLFLGALVERKGPQILLNAAERASRGGVRLRLRFLGAGPLAKALGARIAASKLDAGLLGFVDEDEKWRQLAWADVFVLPTVTSQTEVFPVALLEALASGCAVVTSNLPTLASILSETGAGLTFPADKPEELSTCLCTLASDPTRLKELQQAAQKSRSRYDWAAIAHETMALYQEVLDEGRHPG